MKEGINGSECSVARIIRLLARHRGGILSSTRAELAKRYSGSFLGLAWAPISTALALGIYLLAYFRRAGDEIRTFRRLDQTALGLYGSFPASNGQSVLFVAE